MVEEFLRIFKAVLQGTICMIRLFWTCKLQNCCNFLHWNFYDTIFKRSGEFCLFRFVWRDFKTKWETSMQSHTKRIIQIVPCKTVLIQLERDLYRRIYKREISVKTFCSNWRHEVKYGFLCKQLYLATLNLEKVIFKPENETIYATNDHLWRLKFAE